MSPRYLDLLLLAALLPVFVVTGLPLLGWVVGTGLYAGQRGLSAYLERRAQATEDIRTRVGLLAGGMVGRGYLVSFLLLGVYFALGEDVALAAAVLFLAAFTVYFTITLILRPARGGSTSR